MVNISATGGPGLAGVSAAAGAPDKWAARAGDVGADFAVVPATGVAAFGGRRGAGAAALVTSPAIGAAGAAGIVLEAAGAIGAAGAAGIVLPSSSDATWCAMVKCQPITFVALLLLLTCLIASLRLRLKNFMTRMTPMVPARWTPARQWIMTFVQRRYCSMMSKIGCNTVKVFLFRTACSISRPLVANLMIRGVSRLPAQGGLSTLVVQLITSPMLKFFRRSRSCAARTPPWKIAPSLSFSPLMMRFMVPQL